MTHIEQMIKDMCPNGVEWKTIGDALGVNRGKRLTKSELSENGGYEVYHGSKDTPLGCYTESNAPKDTVIVVNTGGIGGVKYLDKDFWCSDGSFWIGHSNAVNNKFLYYFLSRYEDYFESQKRVGGVPTIDRKVVENFEIPLPPLEIQKKIVECLDKFSALAAELQAELQMRRKQYEYYRTQLLTPHSESNSADKTDDCNWEWKTFTELGTFYGGLSGKSKEDFKDGNAKYVTYLNIGCNPALRLDILETVKVALNEKQNIVKYGDALFTGSSETPDECAMSSVVTEHPTEDIFLNSFCFGFRFDSLDGICPAFYKHYFRCDAFRKAVRRTANGTTRFNVSKKEFAKLSIPIPPIAEQKRIVSILDKFEALTTSLSDGIPAEQAAQQKRYEYYRDLLLTFPRKAV